MNSVIRYLTIKKTIAASGAAVDLATEMDKDYKRCAAISITASDLGGLKGSEFSQPFAVADVNVFPKGHDAEMFYVGKEVKTDDRFYYFRDNLEANGKKVTGEYKDGGNAAAYPYTLKIVLLLSNEEMPQPSNS